VIHKEERRKDYKAVNAGKVLEMEMDSEEREREGGGRRAAQKFL